LWREPATNKSPETEADWSGVTLTKSNTARNECGGIVVGPQGAVLFGRVEDRIRSNLANGFHGRRSLRWFNPSGIGKAGEPRAQALSLVRWCARRIDRKLPNDKRNACEQCDHPSSDEAATPNGEIINGIQRSTGPRPNS
jgi:hypothetical protein